MLSRRSVFYNAFTLTLSSLALQVLGFVYRILLSRTMGAEGMGVYQLALPYYSVISSISLSGLTMAVAQLTAEQTALGRGADCRRTFRLCLGIFFVLLVTVALPTALFSGFISEDILGDVRTRTALLLFLPCLFFTGIENLIKNHFFGANRLKPPIISELSEQTLRILAVYLLMHFFSPDDAGSAAALTVCAMVISEVASAYLLIRFYSRYRPSPTGHCSHGLSRRVFSIAVPVAAASLANTLLNSAISVLIPRMLTSSGMTKTAALQLFGTMFGMTMPLLAFPAAFLAPLNTVTLPRLSEGVAVHNTTDVRRKAAKLLHSTGLFAFPAAALFMPLGTPICRMIFRDPSAGQYMLPMCIATFFSYYQMTTGGILNGIGDQKFAAGSVLAGGVIELLFTLTCGIEGIGIYGFLAGFVISCAAVAFLNLHRIVTRLHLAVMWRNWVITPLLAALLAGSCASFVYRISHLGCTGSLFIACGVFIVIYLSALRAMGVNALKYVQTLIPKNPS